MIVRRITGALGAFFRMIGIGSWALAVGVCVLLVVSMYNAVWKPAFSTRTIVSDNYVGLGLADHEHHYLSWQSPFNYEIKVYTSQLAQLPANHSQFFERAKMIWHIKPRSIENRYPRIKKRLQVNVPASVISKRKPLYAYIFAQKEGQFNPHPNTKDLFLVGAKTTLLSWPERQQHTSAEHSSRQIPMFQSSIHWAIVLENHAYPDEEIPKYLTKVAGAKNGAYNHINLYNPPLMPNLYTTRRPEFKTLDVVWNKRRSVFEYSSKIEIEMNVDGIRAGWLNVRQYISQGLRANLRSDVLNFDLPYNLKPDNTIRERRSFTGLAFIDENSIAILLVVVACVLLIMCLYLVYLCVLFGYYLGPELRRIGCSRTSVLLSLASNLLRNPFYTVAGALGLFTNLSVLLDVTAIIILAQVPLNPWQWTLAFRSYTQSSQQEAANVLPAQITTGTDNNSVTWEQKIIRLRKNVDNSVIGMIRYIGMELSALVMLYTVFRLGFRTPISVIMPNFIANEATIISLIKDVPQILINHRAKSGSLKSVGIPICTLFISVLFATFKYFAVGSFGVNYLWLFVDTIPKIIQIFQWIIYYKVKQD